jgi:hypothetical protein
MKTFQERDEWMWAILASGLPDAAKCVGMAIALRLRINTGRCDPSYAALAAASHRCKRSVYRLVALLERTGWIAAQHANSREIRGRGHSIASINRSTPCAILRGLVSLLPK